MDDLHRMLELVKDPNPQIRRYALGQVEELAGGVDDEDVLEVLREAARDTVPLVSHQAIRSLARLLGRAFLVEHGTAEGGFTDSFEGVPLTELRKAGLEIMAPALERLQRVVESEDKRAARRALIALGKIAAPGTVKVMAACLQDPTLAGAAAIALPGVGGEEALRPLLAAADDPSAPGRLHAILELGRFPTDAARDALVRFARDENAAVRANAAMALGEQRAGPETREVLGELLGDAEVWVTVYAIRALAKDRSAESAQLVATCYHKVEDPHVQASCLAVLGNMGPEARAAAEAVLQAALSHPDDRVRANAVEAVGQLIDDRDSVLRMAAPLSTDPNNRTTANVAVALAPFDLPAALEILGRLARTEDKWFKSSAAWAAGVIAAPEAFPILVDLAGSGEPAILLMVVRSLESFPSQDAVPVLTRLAAGDDAMVRARAAEALGRIGGEQVGQFLGARMKQEPDPVTRAALVNAVASTRSAPVAGILTDALEDSYPRVQANAVEQLGRVGSLDVLSVVRPLARGDNGRLRANAWIALWRLGELEMAGAVAAALDEGKERGLLSALYAIGEMGRELRQLGSQSANLLLLGALKSRIRPGATAPPQEGGARAPVAEQETDVELRLEELLEHTMNADLAGLVAGVRELPVSAPAGIGSYLVSRVKAAQKDQAGALDGLEDACSQGIPCLSPHLELANYYLRQRRDREAGERFLAAYGMRREALGRLSDATRAALREDKLSLVSRALKFLFGQPPMSPDTHPRVGREFLALGDVDQAFQHLFLARIEFPRDPAIALDYAVCALRLGRRELASRVCSFAARAAGSDPRVQQRVQALQESLGRGAAP